MALSKLIQPPRLWSGGSTISRRVTWLELFFDLIFAAAVAQVDAPLGTDYSPAGVFRFLAFLLLVWWAWHGHTLYSTRFDTDDLVQRLLTLVQMFAVAAMAANARDAFDSRYSAGFAAAYAAMRFVLAVQYLRARRIPTSRQLTTHYALGTGIAAAFWLVSALIPPPSRYWTWALALIVDLGVPFLTWRHAERLPPDASHLPERFGLFTIILLGESIVAVMHGMESQEYWSVSAALSAFLGMGIAFCFWWWYFDGAKATAERPIRCRRDVLLFHIWSYVHFPLYLGIAIVAVGIKHIVSLAADVTLQSSEAWILCTATALAMLALGSIGATSELSQRRRLPTTSFFPQCLVASVTLLTGFFGDRVPPVFLVSSLTALCLLQVVLVTRYRDVAWEENEPAKRSAEFDEVAQTQRLNAVTDA
jgi:low temperature requirement protein LtrA